MLGEIKMFAGTFAPVGWAFCNGQLISISENTALYSLLGTYYGGDGRSTFGLPDLRGRVPIGAGSGPGRQTYQNGWFGGNELGHIQLTTDNLPAHSHTADANVGVNVGVKIPVSDNATGNAQSPNGNYLIPGTGMGKPYGDTAAANEYYGAPEISTDATANVAIGNTGNGNAISFDNRQPYQAVNYIICTEGYYPSRN